MTKILMRLFCFPILLLLTILQVLLTILDRLSGFCTGVLTLLLTGLLIHHSTIGNRENVLLLSICLAVCIGVPAVLQILSTLLKWLTNVITA